MFIASKYEEMYAPEIGDFVYITDRAYTEPQIREMEMKILSTLSKKLFIPAKRTPRPAEGRLWRGASVASGACAKRFYKKSSYFDFTQHRPQQK